MKYKQTSLDEKLELKYKQTFSSKLENQPYKKSNTFQKNLSPSPKIQQLDSNPAYKRLITVGRLRETTLTKRQASRALKLEPKTLGKIISVAAYSRSSTRNSRKSNISNKRIKKAEEKK